MANRILFSGARLPSTPVADAVNQAGGLAYSQTSESALAQFVVTATFNGTFYATAEEQVDTIRSLANEVSTAFLAKAAVYGHEVARMKDAPAFLLAALAARIKGPDGPMASRLFRRAFPRVVTNGKMLANFFQIVRSGVTGRKSFGTVAKEAIRGWLESRTADQLYTTSVGVDKPSLADVIKATHPRPESDEKRALFGYLIGRPYDVESLPPKVRALEIFKQGKAIGLSVEVPDVPFQVLASMQLPGEDWVAIARNLPWNALRMNLNTLQRHGVFDGAPGQEMVGYVAAKLANADEVRRARAFPYQLLAAYLNTTDVPPAIRDALQDAVEVATENVPEFGVPVAACIDTSGSMQSAITGTRKGSTSKMRCVDVAALIGATLVRRNKDSVLLPFDTKVHDASSINPRDSIVTNAEKLSRFGGGGTDLGSAMNALLHPKYEFNHPKLIVFVSDNESWYRQSVYSIASWGNSRGTTLAAGWAAYKKLVPDAKLVLIDINAEITTQAPDKKDDTLNVAGWGDAAWSVIDRFVKSSGQNFTDAINAVDL